MIELVTNDRIVGGLTREAAEAAKDLYTIFCQGEILLTDAVTAEMAKLVENSFRDVNIAFANELSMVADKLGIDVWELIRLANHHPRVNILQPGPGVGGHCIAVDPWFIVDADPDQTRLIRTAREVNDGKPAWVVEEICDAIASLDSPTVALLGLAYKPNVGDTRESPALEIISRLAARRADATFIVVDPFVDELPDDLAALPNVCKNGIASALAGSTLAVLLVGHDAFLEPLMQPPNPLRVIDVCGALRDVRSGTTRASAVVPILPHAALGHR
jgi:UDP-N-acetyl-D-mannosaminuronic acid dehydrogenase